MLRQSVANLTFRNISFNFATAISKFDTFSIALSYVNESRRWQSFSLFALSELVYSLFSLSELVCTKNVFTLFYYSLYFLTPSFFPFGAFRTDRFQHPPIPYFFFFPLSARGPTRRRNSTGLAELWGGWPIELAKKCLRSFFGFGHIMYG